MNRPTDADVAFFHEHAGWCYDPATETPEEGRLRCARALAAAEKWLSRQPGHTVEWVEEPFPDYSGIDHDGSLYCCLVSVPGVGRESLGNIDLGPDGRLSDPYTRVVWWRNWPCAASPGPPAGPPPPERELGTHHHPHLLIPAVPKFLWDVAVAAATNGLYPVAERAEFAAQLLDVDVHRALVDAGADDSLD
jgi:hypothetical protein